MIDRPSVRFWAGLASLAALCCIGWLLLWIALASGVLGLHATVVASGSMAPAIEVGDVVLLAPPDAVGAGEVVQFRRAGDLWLHRVVEVRPGALVTRGDANGAADAETVALGDVTGSGRLVVPVLGHWWLLLQRSPTVVPVASALLLLALLATARQALDPRNDPWATAGGRSLRDAVAAVAAIAGPGLAGRAGDTVEAPQALLLPGAIARLRSGEPRSTAEATPARPDAG